MNIRVLFISLILGIFPFTVMAGAGHDHGGGHSHDPVSQSQAEVVAINSVARLVDKSKIDKTWKSTGVANAEKKEFSGRMEWVVSFKNNNVSDPEKQTLYIFLSLTGEYIAANYSGK